MPRSRDEWDALDGLSAEQMQAAGLGSFDGSLCLIPGVWYRFIPRGLVLTSVLGAVEPFVPGMTSDDTRFGYLAWGFTAATRR